MNADGPSWEYLENHPQVQRDAAFMGMSVADFIDGMHRLTKALNGSQEAIEAAHEAVMAAERHPRGRAAQSSPYDIGRRK